MDPLHPSQSSSVFSGAYFSAPEVEDPVRHVLYLDQELPGHATDIVAVDERAPQSATPVIATAADEVFGALADGGRKLVFASNESGRYELYLANADGTGTSRQITASGCSRGGGASRRPAWVVGNEVFYFSIDKRALRSVRLVQRGDVWLGEGDRQLFRLPLGNRGLCPAPDGSRFLVLKRPEGNTTGKLALVQGWHSELKAN